MSQPCTCGSSKEHLCSRENQNFELYGVLGYVHNKALDKIAAQEDFTKLSLEKRHEIARKVVEKELTRVGFTEVRFLPFDQERVIADQITKSDPKDYIEFLYKDGQISNKMKKVLLEIAAAVFGIRNPTQAIFRLQELRDFNAVRVDLSAREKAALRAGFEVGIASVAYWARQARDPKSPWYPVIQAADPDARMKPRWWDLGGAVVNCLGCGLTGGGIAGCIDCAGTSSSFISSIFGSNATA